MNQSWTDQHARSKTTWQQRLGSIALATLLITMAAMTSVVAGVSTSALAQESVPVTATVTPADSLIYLAIDLDPNSPQNQKATELLGRIGAGSVEDLLGEMSSATTGDDVTAGIDLNALLGGEASLAVFDFGADLSAVTGAVEGGLAGDVQPEAEAVPQPSLAGIISAPDPDAAYAAAESSLEDDATTQGVTITDETYEGVTIRVVPGDESTQTSGTALARVGDFVVIGMAADDVEKVIDTQAGRTPALADSDGFTSVLAELSGDWLVNGYVNGEAIAAGLTADPTAAAGLNGIDLAALQSNSGFVIWADDPGFRFDGITIPTVAGAIPSPANFNPELPGMIPSDAVVFSNGYDIGASGILDSIFLAALSSLTGSVGTDMATPDPSKTAEQIAQEQYAQLEAILGFNVKTDFIDQMVGEWGLAVWGLDTDAAASMDPTSVKFLLVSNTQTPATVSDAVSKLSLLIQAGLSGQGTVTTRVIGQDQLNVLTINDDSTPTPIVIEYGVVNGQFVISYNGAIDELVTDGGDSLAQNATYRAALAALPTEYSGQFYVDLTQVVPLVQQASTAMATGLEFADASEKCAEYSTQDAAQETFDADPSLNWELDQDFDGQACEDYFTQDDLAAATPVAMSDQYDALTAIASVTYQRDDMLGFSAILLIQE
jgi:hypothetical protein